MTKAADRTESNVLGGDLCLGFTFSSWSQSWSHVYCWPSEFLVSNSSIPSSGTKSWSNGPGQTCIPCLNGSQSWGRRELEEEGKVSQSYSLRFLICITWAVLKKTSKYMLSFSPFFIPQWWLVLLAMTLSKAWVYHVNPFSSSILLQGSPGSNFKIIDVSRSHEDKCQETLFSPGKAGLPWTSAHAFRTDCTGKHKLYI